MYFIIREVSIPCEGLLDFSFILNNIYREKMQEFSLFSSAAASVNWYVEILLAKSKHSASINISYFTFIYNTYTRYFSYLYFLMFSNLIQYLHQILFIPLLPSVLQPNTILTPDTFHTSTSFCSPTYKYNTYTRYFSYLYFLLFSNLIQYLHQILFIPLLPYVLQTNSI